MPVSISRWNAPPRAPRAIQPAIVCSSPSAGVSRCSPNASNRSARAGVKTSTGRAMPAARSSAPSSIVATPYPQGSSGSSARETATAPTPYAFALTTGRRAAIADAIGDLLFAVVNLARKLETDPRAALAQATAKFQRRFGAVKRLAAERGLDVRRASLQQLDELWDEVKQR